MKYLLVLLTLILFFIIYSKGETKMQEARIIEIVQWKSIDGVSMEDVQTSFKKLNDFVKEQDGFISRRTAISDDGQFVDVVLWSDLSSAKMASEKAMQNEDLAKIFALIDQESMLFKHYEIFNSVEK